MNIRERADAMLGEMWDIARFANNDEALEWRDYFEEQLEASQRDVLTELTPGDMKPSFLPHMSSPLGSVSTLRTITVRIIGVSF